MPGLWRRSKLTLAIALAVAATGQCVLAAGDGWTDLAGPLRSIAARAEAGAVGLQAAVPGVQMVHGQLLVEVQFKPGRASAAAVAAAGGRALHVIDNRADVLIPAGQLLALASRSEIAAVTPVPPLIPLVGYGTVVSEGVQLTNASAFQNNNILGTGARIAVIDTDFANGLADPEIPHSTTDPNPPSFRADGTFGVGDHGTACAEIIADMAPDATIHLFAVDTPESVVTALNYAAANHYQIVSISMGLIDGPFDGSSMVSKAVANARNAGVLVVVAAGNFAQRHWEGDFKDANHNGYCEFGGSSEGIMITAAAAETFVASLSWFETAGATTDQDYDLELFDSTNTMIASSAYAQTGTQAPSDTLVANIPAGTYQLKIHEINADGNAHFQLFIGSANDLPTTLQVPEHSISAPADAAKALTVGATRGSSIDTTPYNLTNIGIDKLEPFSSRGPNVLGVVKPDILGPDVVTTSIATDALGDVFAPFIGTSASAPHVAGAAALLYSEDRTRTADNLASILTGLAYNYWKLPILNGQSVPNDMSSGQDDNYGWGRVTLRVATNYDNTPPTVTWIYPQPGQTVLTRTPTFLASITDTGSGVNASSIVLTLDGTSVAGFTYDSTSGVLSLTSPTTLYTGVHSVSITASDNAGNSEGPVIATFQVVPPSIPAGLQLISLPYKNLQNTDPTAIFTPPGTGSIRLARWVPTDSTSNKYHVYPDPWASFVPPDTTGSNPTVSGPPAGLGYFVNTPGTGTTLLNVQGDVISANSYNINLYRGTVYPTGWNMIGNPYTSAVQWGTVEFLTGNVRQDLTEAISAGVTPGIIYELKNTGTSTYYDFPADPLSATMQPFAGYWVYVTQNTQLTVYNPGVVATSAKVKPETTPWLPKGTWRLQIVTQAGPNVDPSLYIGTSPGCTAGYDAGKDLPKPPPVVSTLQSYLPKDNWGDNSGAYAQDLHAPGGPQTWNFDVLCTTPNTQVTVTWPNLNSVVPNDTKLVLEDPATGKTVYMRTAAAYTFDSGSGGVRALRVTTLNDASQVLALSSVRAQSGPQRSAVVTFSVTHACQADVEVRNISGVPVRRLATGVTATPGTPVSLDWNGVNETGSLVPAGQYLVCITARSDDGQVVQGIRALQIGR